MKVFQIWLHRFRGVLIVTSCVKLIRSEGKDRSLSIVEDSRVKLGILRVNSFVEREILSFGELMLSFRVQCKRSFGCIPIRFLPNLIKFIWLIFIRFGNLQMNIFRWDCLVHQISLCLLAFNIWADDIDHLIEVLGSHFLISLLFLIRDGKRRLDYQVGLWCLWIRLIVHFNFI